MAITTLEVWKQFMEGLRRGDVGPYTQSLRTAGINRWREYHDGPVRRAYMRVDGGAVNRNDNHVLPRQFDVHPQDQAAVAYIYVPTGQDLDDWEEGVNCLADCSIVAEIAAREPVA